jgi:hypothetical protein
MNTDQITWLTEAAPLLASKLSQALNSTPKPFTFGLTSDSMLMILTAALLFSYGPKATTVNL